VHPRCKPVRDQVRVFLGRLPQHPADRLADEELALAEHGVRVAGESRPVGHVAAAQRHEQGQQGRAAHPEVVVGCPPVQDVEEFGEALGQGAHHVRSQRIDERPGAGGAQEALDQRGVRRLEQLPPVGQEDDGGRLALEQRAVPERRCEPDELPSREVRMSPAPSGDDSADHRDRDASELERAREVLLLVGCACS
jgi:hypothetical protein